MDALDAKKPVSLLDVIKNAVQPEPAPTAPSAVVEDSEVPAVAEVPAVVADPVVVADADLPFHNHPRWQQVIAENQSLREPAEQMGKISSFMEANGLSGEEVAEGYEIMALLKSGDAVKLTKARDWFSSRLEYLDESLGNVLPDDLQERVESGAIDESGAQELARARAADTLRDSRAATDATALADAKAVTDGEAAGAAMASAVNDWEARTKATDPDYARKAQLIQTTCLAIVQRTGIKPSTAAEAVALTEAALKDVNAQLKSLAPTPKAITRGPHGASTTTVAEPKTLREAINGAVGL